MCEIIRLSGPEDYAETEQLAREAFWNVYRPGCMEHLVLRRLRSSPDFIPELDYVIEENGRLAAQIVYARCRVVGEGNVSRNAALFGPVSVLPELQGRGYGSRPISYTLEKAKELGFPAVLITGAPAYYSRFGFVSAARYGIRLAGAPKDEECPYFMIKALDEERARQLEGVWVEPEAYHVTDEEVELFDRQFPPKRREKRPGQLDG